MGTEDIQEIKSQLDRIEKCALGQKPVLSFDECCAYTNISKSHMYKLTQQQLIPHSKPEGKKLYFDREKIDDWLLRNPILTRQEIDRRATSYVATNKSGK